jgi:lipid-A-disaccharide synthase
MKYYLIVGEASGDLHASRLMQALKEKDETADFRFFGGDLMAAVGGTCVKHYKELAYMGFVPVLLHLRTIFRNMAFCKQDIVRWQPDVVILVDYPGFNLDIAKFVHGQRIPVYYYISPKIWAWKEWRIKSIKRNVDEMFSILPFEVPFYEEKHHYKIHYVGNPTADEVKQFRDSYTETIEAFRLRNHLDGQKPIVALLAGSRKQEIKDNLPGMLRAVNDKASQYEWVIAGAPSIDADYYAEVIKKTQAATGDIPSCLPIVYNDTYALLSHATVALVTSGTATLETALFDVPQVVCYETPVPHLIRFGFKHIIKVRFISLVNLIADQEIVQELLADRFTVANIRNEFIKLLPGGQAREKMLADYQEVHRRLGDAVAPDNAAQIMIDLLKTRNRI